MSYLEIGSAFGDSLAFVECPTIAIDPEFSKLRAGFVGRKEVCALFQMPSDRFFETYDPTVILGRSIDMAFLDGMHRCEFLLRDFANTERYCRPNSVIFLHDCVPVEAPIVERINGMRCIEPHRKGWWLGDVWRALLALKRRRSDLRITVLNAPPSGLACITNLDPKSTTLTTEYAEIVEEMLSWSLDEIGLTRYHEMLDIQPTSSVDSNEKITRRFWL